MAISFASASPSSLQGVGGSGRFLPSRANCKAFGDQTFADILDRLHPAVEGGGNLHVRPVGPHPHPPGAGFERDETSAMSL
jgi:hypothetical protein